MRKIENHFHWSLETAFPYFLYSLGILFREGFEALLVIVALAAGIDQTEQRDATAWDVYGGALAAVGVSIALAWAVNSILADNTSDALEGTFQLLAAATIFYVSSWLAARSGAGRWRQFISARLESAARSAVPSTALGLTAFLAVLREGAETIVFFQGLVAGATEAAEKRAVVAGMAVAAVGLMFCFVALRRAMASIPVRAFFGATSVLLYLLAMVFVGQGIASWQEAGMVSATFVGHVPTIQALGFYPTLQTLIAQSLVALLALAATIGPRARLLFAPAHKGDSGPHRSRRAAA